jgi:hypothetical protein
MAQMWLPVVKVGKSMWNIFSSAYCTAAASDSVEERLQFLRTSLELEYEKMRNQVRRTLVFTVFFQRFNGWQRACRDQKTFLDIITILTRTPVLRIGFIPETVESRNYEHIRLYILIRT